MPARRAAGARLTSTAAPTQRDSPAPATTRFQRSAPAGHRDRARPSQSKGHTPRGSLRAPLAGAEHAASRRRPRDQQVASGSGRARRRVALRRGRMAAGRVAGGGPRPATSTCANSRGAAPVERRARAPGRHRRRERPIVCGVGRARYLLTLREGVEARPSHRESATPSGNGSHLFTCCRAPRWPTPRPAPTVGALLRRGARRRRASEAPLGPGPCSIRRRLSFAAATRTAGWCRRHHGAPPAGGVVVRQKKTPGASREAPGARASRRSRSYLQTLLHDDGVMLALSASQDSALKSLTHDEAAAAS